MWNAIQMNIFQIHEMFPAIVIHLHQGNETNTRNAEVEVEIQHLVRFFCIINVTFNQIATGVHLLQVYPFKVECLFRYSTTISL